MKKIYNDFFPWIFLCGNIRGYSYVAIFISNNCIQRGGGSRIRATDCKEKQLKDKVLSLAYKMAKITLRACLETMDSTIEVRFSSHSPKSALLLPNTGKECTQKRDSFPGIFITSIDATKIGLLN